LLRVGLPAQEIEAVQVCGAAAVITDKVKPFAGVPTQIIHLRQEVLLLRFDTPHRTVHLDIVNLPVID